jgi:DNA-binding XRE family transcriptional regulator
MKEYGMIDLNEKPDSRIGTLRIKAGLTQSELADVIGASVRTVQVWETEGMGGASLLSAYKVSKVLKCPMTALLNEEDLKWKP